jgi:hypothetical protein
MNKFKDTDFDNDEEAVNEAARLMVEDNFERYHLGLVIPLNAGVDYEG